MDHQKPPPVRESPPPKPRRVYKVVSVGDERMGVSAVLLDGKPALTPQRKPLAARTRALADALAGEWDAQNPHVEPETMPLTRLVATAIDRVGPQRAAVIDGLLTYVDTDSICYRAAYPADLRARQERLWRPVTDWLARDHAITLRNVEGLMPAAQPGEVAERMRAILETMDDAHLTAFQATAGLTSSLALAFALVCRKFCANDIFAAAFLDEIYQAEKWGEDDIASARRTRLAGDITAVERFLALSAVSAD